MSDSIVECVLRLQDERDLLLAEVAELKDEVAKWKWEYENLSKFATDFERRCEGVGQENRRMRVALGEISTYGFPDVDSIQERARDALDKPGGEDGK